MLTSVKRGFARAAALAALVVLACAAPVTIAAGAAPDGRAYELVSPPDKNGGDIVADSARTRAASDGEAISFLSLTAFGDAAGTGISSEYVAERSRDANPGSNGWATHAINPVHPVLPFRAIAAGFEPRFEGEFTEDLRKGVFSAFGALDGTAEVAEVGNLYVGVDLRRGSGEFDLISACPLCVATRTALTPLPRLSALANVRRTVLGGMSADGEHVAFETTNSLTSEGAAAQDPQCDPAGTVPLNGLFCRVHAYEWDGNTVRLVGVLPDGRPADVSILGSGAGANRSYNNRNPHVVSNGADGHTRIFFTQPTDASGNLASSLAGFNRINTARGFRGLVFARIDGTTTIRLNESERVRQPVDAYAPAMWLDASADGSRVFFMTSQALTDDATVDTANKLYMYDASKPPGAPDNLSLLNPRADETTHAIGMIGASTDGRYVYMGATGQLVRGQPLLSNDIGLYLWHDGAISFIGYFANPGDFAEAASTGTNYVLQPRQGRVTPDGKHALFSATLGQGFTGYDHGNCISALGFGCRELYLYSADARDLRCVSCRPGGEAATEMAAVGVRTNNSGSGTTWHETNAISDDGRWVFFNTAESLVTSDTNGLANGYAFDSTTGSLQLLSSGAQPSESWFLDASANGRDVFLLTRERLVGWDVDTAYDVYDARIGGGFPEPVRGPPGCGDACQGLPGVAPGAAVAGSERFRGSGNVSEKVRRRSTRRARRCRRGFVQKRVRGKRRCVKRTTSRNGKRAAAVNRRNS